MGGRRNSTLKGLFFEPTVLTNVTADMDVMTKETFGRIIAIQKASSDEEAVRLANASEFGLSGTVWTTDPGKGVRLAEQMETGGVCVNDITVTYGIPEAPFGGVKVSGVGQVNGRDGLRRYCHAQPIVVDRKTKGPLLNGFPYSLARQARTRRILRGFLGSRVLRRLLG